MNEVRTEHSGKFTITGHGQPAPDGQFIATFVVTEAVQDGEAEMKRSTGEKFPLKHLAIEAALKAGMEWLEHNRPPNSWEAKR